MLNKQSFGKKLNIVLVCMSLIISLIFIEIGIRFIFPGKFVYYSTYRSPILRYGPYGIMLAPNFQEIEYGYRVHNISSPLVPWRVKINNLGWREPDNTSNLARQQGVKRLMVLGDSVTYGMTLDYKYTHSSYLHHALLLDPNHNWVVLNRSVPGWGGWHEREYFRLDGRSWNPEVVTVNVIMNDFMPISDAEFKAQVNKVPVVYGIYKRFQFLNFIRFAFMRVPSQAEVLEFYRVEVSKPDYGHFKKDKWWYIRGEYDTPEKEAVYQKANELSYPRYIDIKQECDSIGAYCLVVIYPTANQTSRKYWIRQKGYDAVLEARPINDFCDYLRKNDIPFINLLDAFRAEEVHPLFVDECHLSEYGHRIAADEVIKHLVKKKIIQLYDMPFWE